MTVRNPLLVWMLLAGCAGTGESGTEEQGMGTEAPPSTPAPGEPGNALPPGPEAPGTPASGAPEPAVADPRAPSPPAGTPEPGASSPANPPAPPPTSTETPAVPVEPNEPAAPVDMPSVPVEVPETAGIASVLVVPDAAPASRSGFGSDWFSVNPVAVAPDGDRVFVGYNDEDAPSVGVLVGTDGTRIELPGAVVAGVAVTSDGVAALLFDPNESVDDRVWAAVARFDTSGAELFRTELFHSPNLEDVGSKGAPSTSRLGYLVESDTLVAYFAHTQRYDDGVRHQGGYLASVDAAGEQEVLNDWFGSHNLDQRLGVDGTSAYLLGLGDAYPEGIFFAATEEGGRMNPRVILPLASAGNGATNGQLGGIVDLGSELLIPFITNQSVPPDLDAGTWPDIDDEIANRIREAASHGTDIGVLRLDKGALPASDTTLDVTWLDVGRSEDTSLASLKSAALGDGTALLMWAESTGSGRTRSSEYLTLVLASDGSVAIPKASLADVYAFSAGDDIVPRGAGVVWASAQSDGIHLVSYNP